VKANSTRGQGSRRAVAPSDDDYYYYTQTDRWTVLGSDEVQNYMWLLMLWGYLLLPPIVKLHEQGHPKCWQTFTRVHSVTNQKSRI
jgi:hypothetical protein